MHGCTRKSGLVSDCTDTPMRPVLGLRIERLANQQRNFLIGDRSRTTWLKFFVQALDPMVKVTLALDTDRGFAQTQSISYGSVGPTVGCHQHNLGSDNESVRQTSRTSDGLKLQTLVTTQA